MRLRLMLFTLFLAPLAFGQTKVDRPTPAQQKIAWAEVAIKVHPDHSQPYNDLAMAYVSRARETSNPGYYEPADAALEKSFAISLDNFEGLKARVMILLGRKEFTEALGLARSLNKRTPDDVLVYGLVADADMELGNYSDAERTAQWMLDIRPGNVPGLIRGARLRRLFGDAEGAMDFYTDAYQQTPPMQTEELAWILTQMADLHLSLGNLDRAKNLVHSALEKFPAYPATLEELARVQAARGQYAAVVETLRERNRNFPSLASRYALAEALERAGEMTEAGNVYAAFEQDARQLIDAAGNANTELMHYYLGRANKPAEALRIARIEIERRHDVRTRDAYAWTLYANGQFAKASEEIRSTLAVGVRDAELFYHAGAISVRLNDPPAASRYFKQSLEVNPSSNSAAAAREALQKLEAATAVSLAVR